MKNIFKHIITKIVFIFLFTCPALSQENSIFSKAYHDIQELKKIKSKGNLDLALEGVQKIRKELSKLIISQDFNVFSDYSTAVLLESDIYDEKEEYLKLSNFQNEQAELVKPFIAYGDDITKFYFNYKTSAASSYIEGNGGSMESRKIATQKLTALRYEMKRAYFDNAEEKNFYLQNLSYDYFLTKVNYINSLAAGENRTLESLKYVKQRLDGVLGELKMRNFIILEETEKKLILGFIESAMDLNNMGTSALTLQEGRFQSLLAESEKDKNDYSTKKNGDFFEKEHFNNQNFFMAGMYQTLIGKQKMLLKKLKNYGVSTSEPDKYNDLCYLVNFNLYSAHLNLRDYENALLFLKRSKEFYLKLPSEMKTNKGYVSFNRYLSSLYLAQRKYDLALEYSFKDIEENNEFSKFQYGTIARIHYELKNFNKAIKWQLRNITALKKITTYDNKISIAFAYVQLASYHMVLDQYNEAEKYLLEAQKLKIEIREDVFSSYYFAELAILSLKKERYEEADDAMLKFAKQFELSFFEILLAFNEEERALYSSIGKYNPNLLFYFLSLRKENSNKIVSSGYDYALLSKQLLLNTSQTIRNNTTINEIPELKNINDKWTDVKNKLKDVDVKNRDSLMDYARVYEKELIARGKKSIVQLYQNSKIEWKDIRNELTNQEVAIEFISFTPYETEKNANEVRYAAFILGKEYENPIFINLFKESELNEILQPVISKKLQPKNQVSEIYEKNGNQVYDIIWKPLESYLSGIKRIYFSPTGALHNLSFAALPTGNKEFLGDKYILNQLSSTKEIITDKLSHDLRESVLFGDITYDNKREISKDLVASNTRGRVFNELQGTKIEVDEINILLKDNDISTVSYTKDKATESNFLRSTSTQPDILHIATHAFYLEPIKDDFFMTDMIGYAKLKGDNDPMNRSGLALTGANYFWKHGDKINSDIEDGILTANEISNLDMKNIELVVLSACETGLGESADNEGVFGLQRGLKMAGVQSLLVSLWKVNDKTTQEYMVEFYKNLIGKNMTVNEAYITTQKIMKQKYLNPYNWAAFVLID